MRSHKAVTVHFTRAQSLLFALHGTSVFPTKHGIRWTTVGLMPGRRRRRWPNIRPTVVQRIVVAGKWYVRGSADIDVRGCSCGRDHQVTLPPASSDPLPQRAPKPHSKDTCRAELLWFTTLQHKPGSTGYIWSVCGHCPCRAPPVYAVFSSQPDLVVSDVSEKNGRHLFSPACMRGW